MIAPPSLSALPLGLTSGNALVPTSASALNAGAVDAGSAASGADPFGDLFLISVLRDELGAEVVDLPLKPIADAATPVDPAAGDPAGLLPLFRVDCFPGPVAEPIPRGAMAALPNGAVPAADEPTDDTLVVPALPIDLPLLKPVTPDATAQASGTTLLAGGECYAPGTEIDDLPGDDYPLASAPGGRGIAPDAPDAPVADDDRTTFAGGEGGKVAAKSLSPEPSIWTAPPITRLDVPSTTWRADATKSRDVQELLASKIAEGGAEVAVTHAGALPMSPPSVTAISPIASAGFHTTAPAVTTTRNDTTVAGDNAQRIVQSIRLQWAGGGGEARITLEPSHLGELTVTLKVDQGVVAVRLQAETPIVREWLQTHAQTLRQGLAEHQLTLDRLEIAGPANADQSRDRDQQGSPSRQFRESRRDRRPGDHATFDLEA